MSAPLPWLAALLSLALIALPNSTGPGQASETEFSATELKRILRHGPLPPPPPSPTNAWAADPDAAHLGRLLFFDPGLSGDGTISCATCHDPALAFTDGKALAEGVGLLGRHTPTVIDGAYQRWFFWDGRADSLWAQVAGPLEHPLEMNGSRLAALHHVAETPHLRLNYEQVFGPLPAISDARRFPRSARPMADTQHADAKAWSAMAAADRDLVNRTFSNLAKSIAAFERLLLSADAPFDEFIKALASGDPTGGDHLSPSARRGLRLFIGRGNCTVCHAGPLFTDGEFHNIAVPPLAPTPTGSAAGDPGVTGVTGSLGAGGANRAGTFDDSGRWAGEAKVLADPFNALGAFADTPRKNGRPTGPAADKLTLLLPSPDHWGEFKTPSLRHVAKTAPYMHQGQFASLDEVLHYYSTLEGAVRSGHHQEQILVPLHLTDGEKDDLIAFLTSLGAGIDDPTLLEPPRPGAAPASAGTNRQGR